MNAKVHNRHLKNARHMLFELLLTMQSAILERLAHFTGWVHLRVLEKAPTPTIYTRRLQSNYGSVQMHRCSKRPNAQFF